MIYTEWGGVKTDSGLAFMSPSFGYADSYVANAAHQGQETMKYSVNITNPLVVELDKNVELDNSQFTQRAYFMLTKKPAFNLRSGDPLPQIELDRGIAKALKKSKYDAVLYKGKDGRVFEVAVDPSKMGTGVRVGKVDNFARSTKVTKENYEEYEYRMIKGYNSSISDSEARQRAHKLYLDALKKSKR